MDKQHTYQLQSDNSESFTDSCYENDEDEASSEPSTQVHELKKRVVLTTSKAEEQKIDKDGIAVVNQNEIPTENQIFEGLRITKLPELAPLPLIKTGASVAQDMKEGWRPQRETISGAPIPLNYEYEPFVIPNNPETLKPYVPLYLGPRLFNSLEVHKSFASKTDDSTKKVPKIYDCGPYLCDPENPQKSYNFKFPKKVPYKLPREEPERKFTGMNPQFDLSDELIFDSNFESGNLDMVIKTANCEYDLYMRVDTNTRGHHQWFYFTLTYPTSYYKKSVQFTVCNFTKDSSLYDAGMRIAIAKKSQDYTWFKAGEDIKYGQSRMVRRNNYDPSKIQYYYQLRFKYTFDSKLKTDTVCFAYCFPYTVTKLQRFLREINVQQKESDFHKESILCKSLSGLDVPLLTVTSRLQSDPKHYSLIKLQEFEDPDSRLSLPLYKKKKYVIIASRVHPGESNASFMMQGLIRYLLGDSHQAKELRKRVVFKIIPMTNPDGVIIGNYRTSMSGHDLNRRYLDPDFRLHPTVCAIKNLTNDLVFGKNGEQEDIVAFIDMHGHSRKKNTFVYGPQVPLHSDKYFKMRIIPKLIAEETSKFRYFSCKFRHERSKLKAARIVMYKQFNIFNCYTYESSLHGYFDDNNVNYEFNIQTYEEMGEHLVNSLYEYLMIVEEDERRKRLKEIEKKKKKKQKRLYELKLAQTRQEAKAEQQSTSELAAVQSSALPKRKNTIVYRPTSREKNGSVIKDEERKGKKSEKKKKVADLTRATLPLSNINYGAQNEVEASDVSNKYGLLRMQNNPNEPPSSGNSIDHRNLMYRTRSNNRMNQEFPDKAKKTSRGFRTMKDMLKSIQVLQETEIQKTDSDENEISSDGGCESVTGNDDLSKDEQSKLFNNIFEAITQFSKLNNISESEYYSTSSKSNQKKQVSKKKLKPNQVDQITEKSQTNATDQRQKKFVVSTKKTAVLPNTYMNYQSNTLSIQQKRRSFHSDLKTQIPQLQESLHQQMNPNMYGALSEPQSTVKEQSQFQRTDFYNFYQRQHPQLHQIANLVFGQIPEEQTFQHIRQNPAQLLSNGSAKPYNIMTQQSRALQQTFSTKQPPTFDCTYFQQQFIQPMTFNFQNATSLQKSEELTQGNAMRGGIKAGRNKAGMVNSGVRTNSVNKVKQRYQTKQNIRKKSASKLDQKLIQSEVLHNEMFESDRSEDKSKFQKSKKSLTVQKGSIQFVQGEASNQTNQGKLQKYDSPYRNKMTEIQFFSQPEIQKNKKEQVETFISKPSLNKWETAPRTSVKSIKIPDPVQKLPNVTYNSNEYRRGSCLNLKGQSENNVFLQNQDSMIIQNKRDVMIPFTGKQQLSQIKTNPMLQDIFVDKIFINNSNGLIGSEVRDKQDQELDHPIFHTPSHLLHNFKLKKQQHSKTVPREEEQRALYPEFMKRETILKQQRDDIKSSRCDYIPAIRVNSAHEQEYCIKKVEKTSHFTSETDRLRIQHSQAFSKNSSEWLGFPSVDQISTRISQNLLLEKDGKQQKDDMTYFQMQRDIVQMETQLQTNQMILERQNIQNNWRMNEVQKLPIAVVERSNKLRKLVESPRKSILTQDILRESSQSAVTTMSLERPEVISGHQQIEKQNQQTNIFMQIVAQTPKMQSPQFIKNYSQQITYEKRNIFGNDQNLIPMKHGQPMIRIQKTKYKPYSLKKTNVVSPQTSPRSISPKAVKEEALKDRTKKAIKQSFINNATINLKPQEAQRVIQEIAMKQFLQNKSNQQMMTNYGPLTRQLTGAYAERGHGTAGEPHREDIRQKQNYPYQLANLPNSYCPANISQSPQNHIGLGQRWDTSPNSFVVNQFCGRILSAERKI